MNKTIRAILRYIIAQNCFYLISGFLMLLGCFLMSKAPGADDVQLRAGLKLLSAVVVYQVIVVAMAVKVRRLGVMHDAFNLALVALVLLLDPTFFSTRFWGHSFAAGLWVNGATWLISIGMFAALVRAGGFPIDPASARAWIFALTVVYLGAAGLAPEMGMGQAVFAVLCFVPLIHAVLARSWDASGPVPAAIAAVPVPVPAPAPRPVGDAAAAGATVAGATLAGATVGGTTVADTAGAGRADAATANTGGTGGAGDAGRTGGAGGAGSAGRTGVRAGGDSASGDGVSGGNSHGASLHGVISGDEHPVLWGDPRSIYTRYLNALLMFYPFLVSFRHLSGLGESFNFNYDFAQLAPGILGLAILLAKTSPIFITEVPWVLHGLGLMSLFLALGSQTVRVVLVHGFAPIWFAPMAAMLGANALFGLWVWGRRGERTFPVYAFCCSIAMAVQLEGGSATGLQSIVQPAPLACLALWLAAWARYDRGFWEIYNALAAIVLWVLQSSTMGTQTELAILSQVLPAIYLVLVHTYPRKDLKNTCVPVAACAVAVMLIAAHSGDAHASIAGAALWGQVALLWIAGRCTQGVAYGPLAIVAAVLDVGVRLSPHVASVDFAGLARDHAGPVALVCAFAALYAGYRVTLKKEEILQWIDDEPDKKDGQGDKRN